MTSEQVTDSRPAAAANEDAVVHYLQTHDDFFERQTDLLTSLRLPHDSGAAVSLVERQVEALRGEIERYKSRIASLLDLARENDELNKKLHRLTLALIEAVDFDEMINILEDHLHEEFRADAVELRLFSSTELRAASEDADPQPGVAAFMRFFQQQGPVCGQLSDTQMDYLFGAQAEDVGSAALLPLRSDDILGVLAIGSSDKQRFHADMGTEFLIQLAEVVSCKLQVVSLPGV
jgi:hypothetical protein